ncbi:hypothetical protein WNY59_12625 [Ahrensia kielensis]|uniref:Secreted protein n=1 Tax=Ahrensia kielensis TaxID=76980 RepID=A0ABU9T9U8_9HYPH
MKEILKRLLIAAVIIPASLSTQSATAAYLIVNGKAADVLDCKGNRYKDADGWHDMKPTWSCHAGLAKPRMEAAPSLNSRKKIEMMKKQPDPIAKR